MKYCFVMILVLIGYSCLSDAERYPDEVNLVICEQLEEDAKTVKVIITAPAGEFPRYTYLKDSKKLKRNELQKVDWDFLPLPGNQGFVTNSLGQNELPLEVLVIAEAQPIGSCQMVQPIAALELHQAAHKETIFITIPADDNNRLVHSETFLDFMLDHDAVKYLIQSWFVNRKGPDAYDQVLWRNEQFAASLISQGIKAASND